jgi:drug/metabolite transporter (DMT)-like permease
MKPLDLAELLILAAIWGASFLFMRVATPEFGPVALIAVRVGIAALVMLPLLAALTARSALRDHWRALLRVGLFQSALPFCLFAFATLSLPAGFAAVLNATAALWGALIGWRFFGTQLSSTTVVGLTIGFGGVVVMVSEKLIAANVADTGAVALAVAACLVATACYGYAANFTRARLGGVSPLVIAGGSQLFAAATLAPLGLLLWPDSQPSLKSWGSAVALGALCTAVAYGLYFRLMSRVGVTKAITVTLLVPVFGILLGIVFLDERLTITAAIGALFVLFGTGLALGLIPLRLLPGRTKTATAGASETGDR